MTNQSSTDDLEQPAHHNDNMASRTESSPLLPHSPIFPPTGSVISSITNLSNTILGTGMLAMPFAVASLGLLEGIILILLAAGIHAFNISRYVSYTTDTSQVASNTGLVLLSRSAAFLHTRKASFYAIAMSEPAWPGAAIAMDLAVAIKCWGVSISYLIVVGDLGSSMFASDTTVYGPSNPIFWISLGIVLISPVTFMQKLDSLKCMRF
jgi:amino acid permease